MRIYTYMRPTECLVIISSRIFSIIFYTHLPKPELRLKIAFAEIHDTPRTKNCRGKLLSRSDRYKHARTRSRLCDTRPDRSCRREGTAWRDTYEKKGRVTPARTFFTGGKKKGGPDSYIISRSGKIIYLQPPLSRFPSSLAVSSTRSHPPASVIATKTAARGGILVHITRASLPLRHIHSINSAGR